MSEEKEYKYVYRPMVKVVSHDCWGRYEVDYEPSEKVYANYEDAVKVSANGEVKKIKVL